MKAVPLDDAGVIVMRCQEHQGCTVRIRLTADKSEELAAEPWVTAWGSVRGLYVKVVEHYHPQVAPIPEEEPPPPAPEPEPEPEAVEDCEVVEPEPKRRRWLRGS